MQFGDLFYYGNDNYLDHVYMFAHQINEDDCRLVELEGEFRVDANDCGRVTGKLYYTRILTPAFCNVERRDRIPITDFDVTRIEMDDVLQFSKIGNAYIVFGADNCFYKITSDDCKFVFTGDLWQYRYKAKSYDSYIPTFAPNYDLVNATPEVNSEGWVQDAVRCSDCGKLLFKESERKKTNINDFICDDCIEKNGLSRCNDCGYYYPENQISYLDGYHVCDNCKAHWRQCPDCGEWYNDAIDGVDIHSYRDPKRVCSSCADENYNRCEDCGIYGDEDYVELMGDDRYICEGCRDDHYYWCDHCEQYFRESNEVRVAGNHSEYWCDDCRDRYSRYCEDCDIDYDGNLDSCPCCGGEELDYFDGEIRDYHHKALRLQFLSMENGVPKSDRIADDRIVYYGVELEGDTYNGEGDKDEVAQALAGVNFCQCENDCSLCEGGSYSGVETITQPCTLDYHLNSDMWDVITRAYYDAGMRSQDSGTCGLHIHASLLPFRAAGIEDSERKLMYAIEREDFKDKWVALSRRRNSRYCRLEPACDGYRDSYPDSWSLPHDDHGRGVNFDDHDTIEFRFPRGTLKVSTIKATIWLIDAVCRFVLSGGDVNECTFEELTDLANAPDFVTQYVQSRGIHVPNLVLVSEDTREDDETSEMVAA